MRVLGLAAALLLSGGAALAEDAPAVPAAADGVAGHFQVRLRGALVSPDASAKIFVSGAAIGGTTKATDSFIPEADLTYFVTDNIGVEAIAGVTRHTVTNSVAGRVGSVSLLPPTVTVQYHLDPTGPIRPYVGAGVNYTFFYDATSTLPDIKFAHNFGWALQAGVDVPVGDGPYFVNLDAKKIFLGTTVRAGSGAVFAPARLDPWLIGAGVGVRF